MMLDCSAHLCSLQNLTLSDARPTIRSTRPTAAFHGSFHGSSLLRTIASTHVSQNPMTQRKRWQVLQPASYPPHGNTSLRAADSRRANNFTAAPPKPKAKGLARLRHHARGTVPPMPLPDHLLPPPTAFASPAAWQCCELSAAMPTALPFVMPAERICARTRPRR